MRDMTTDPVDARLRAARPAAADVDPDAFDAGLLADVTSQAPAGAPRGRRLALPTAALAAVAIAAVVVLAGSPSAVHAPSPDAAAAAVRRAAGWFAMPPGKVLHYRSVMRSDFGGDPAPALTQEVWQSTDDPARRRYATTVRGAAVEQSGGDIYDPARDTIYAYVAPSTQELVATVRRAMDEKIHAARSGGRGDAVVARLRADRARLIRRARAGELADGPADMELGDPNIERIHRAFDAGRASAGAPLPHDGVDARPITLTDARGRVRWVLWTAVDDGRPLELVIDHGAGSRAVETVEYERYELLPAGDADRLLTLRGAHPDAHVIRSRTAYRAAQARLFPGG